MDFRQPVQQHTFIWHLLLVFMLCSTLHSWLARRVPILIWPSVIWLVKYFSNQGRAPTVHTVLDFGFSDLVSIFSCHSLQKLAFAPYKWKLLFQCKGLNLHVDVFSGCRCPLASKHFIFLKGAYHLELPKQIISQRKNSKQERRARLRIHQLPNRHHFYLRFRKMFRM